jgi:hypothetical protein
MPRFYFHLQADGRVVSDPQGAVLPDDEAAWYHAFRSARDLMAEGDGAAPGEDGFIQVEDEAGQPVLSLPLIEVTEFAR